MKNHFWIIHKAKYLELTRKRGLRKFKNEVKNEHIKAINKVLR